MTRRADFHRITAVALAALLIAVSHGCSKPKRTGQEETGAIVDTEEVLAPEETVAVTLYFPGRGDRLHGEERQIPAPTSPEVKAARLVEELLRGPTGPSLYPPLPAGVLLAGVHVDAGATALVDLTPPEGSGPPSWGSKRELLAVYSLVDTILFNVPEIERVAFLWNSQQRPTFAGHVDTTYPLVADRSLVTSRQP